MACPKYMIRLHSNMKKSTTLLGGAFKHAPPFRQFINSGFIDNDDTNLTDKLVRFVVDTVIYSTNKLQKQEKIISTNLAINEYLSCDAFPQSCSHPRKFYRPFSSSKKMPIYNQDGLRAHCATETLMVNLV
jgi:hypothetical protein